MFQPAKHGFDFHSEVTSDIQIYYVRAMIISHLRCHLRISLLMALQHYTNAIAELRELHPLSYSNYCFHAYVIYIFIRQGLYYDAINSVHNAVKPFII